LKLNPVLLEPPGQRRPEPVIRHELQGGVMTHNGEFGPEFRAQVFLPGIGEFGAYENRGHAGVIHNFPGKIVFPFLFAGKGRVKSEGAVITQPEITARLNEPGKIIGIAVGEIPLGTNGVLQGGSGV